MKKFLLAFFAAAAVTLSAVDLDGSWYLNTWAGYRPLAKMTKEKDGSLSFSEVNGKYGFGIMSRNRLKVKAGDTVKFTAMIKGKGKIFFQLQNLDANLKWLAVAPPHIRKEIPADWQEVSMSLKVINVKKTVTGFVTLTCGAGKGDILCIKNSKAEVIPAKTAK